jgi:hypothetical protein
LILKNFFLSRVDGAAAAVVGSKMAVTSGEELEAGEDSKRQEAGAAATRAAVALPEDGAELPATTLRYGT